MNKPLASSTADERLKLYLKEAQIYEGETLHSFRSGSAITLALSGSKLADIMSHVGWTNKETALYYMKLAEVLRVGSLSHLLSADSSATSALTENYMRGTWGLRYCGIGVFFMRYFGNFDFNVRYSLAVCGISSFWLTVFGEI